MSEQPEISREYILNTAAGFLIQQLGTRGITVTPLTTEEGHILEFETGGSVSMDNLADEMQRLPQQDWQETLHRWLDFSTAVANTSSEPELSSEELSARIRTRIFEKSQLDADGFEYARTFGGDLLQVLCIDHPTHVTTLTQGAAQDLGVPLEELFAQGQRNTNAEPIEEGFEKDGVHFVTGDSMFIASKVADIPALLQQLGVEAPEGLMVAVPNRSAILYSRIDPDAGINNLVPIVQTLSALTPEAGFDAPGGMLSRNVYYWLPDGTFEPQLGVPQEALEAAAENDPNLQAPEPDTVFVKPGPRFAERFLTED
ncbi:hypothetical protein [Pseudoglutamicibacter albus]|uniref:Uncharacterized protein n=1 Tax=Pseudoglutamicibacter albus TaxID=98671 RepID=A0ABU1YZX0_9MICC|nr:hypothetical protein [Pseudoglutamicibacter albus]MDR7293913.1 hypothetical protein [Pseudoglutamicibacter albus]